jgi:hypothetical protein
MKPNEHCDNVRSVHLQRVSVHFEIACASAIAIRDANGSNAARHASLFMPNLLVRHLLNPHTLSSPNRISPPTVEPTSIPIGPLQTASEWEGVLTLSSRDAIVRLKSRSPTQEPG